ncbi:hypothetical protein HYH03_002975 [Edaphochlamys debaryana]|uniref:Protein kinase domain-containing protein n=1 Tax=Edaphochlamys debaryana TaxID=47281 RepID=A0A835YEG8_9CHLO|nr:hypothetical protein HYH03_002975 [Edaphochlamys debaryana]|eukprot:KAG2499401.1 hypothetical protein HYH03_002975 [Edaphochlamys debaryana]
MSGEVKLLPVVLGKGTFGKVYQGLWNGQRVAVKRLDLGLAAAGVRQATVEAAEGGGGGRAPAPPAAAPACAAAVRGRGAGGAAPMAADGCFAAAGAEAGAAVEMAAISTLGGNCSAGLAGSLPTWVLADPAILQLLTIASSVTSVPSVALWSAFSPALSPPPYAAVAAAAGDPSWPRGWRGQNDEADAPGPAPPAVAPLPTVRAGTCARSSPTALAAPCKRVLPPCGAQPPGLSSRQSAPAAVSLTLVPGGQQQQQCPQADGEQEGDTLSLPFLSDGTFTAVAWSPALEACPDSLLAGSSRGSIPAPLFAQQHGYLLPPALHMGPAPPAPRPRLRGGLAALFQRPQALLKTADYVVMTLRSRPQLGPPAVQAAGDEAAAATSNAALLCKQELSGGVGAASAGAEEGCVAGAALPLCTEEGAAPCPGADGNRDLCEGASDKAAVEAHAQVLLEACFFKTFVAEVEVMARLHHPNIIRLLAASLQPPHVCLVMELAETSLEHLLYGRGPGARLLPLDTVLHIGMQICSALAYMHPTVVHRDLKPANVLLVNADSATPTVKLADFGLSSLQSTVRFTMHAGVGTAAYMAPETMHPHGAAVSHHVDMYAVGMILYELLAGQPPWAGMTIVQIAVAVALNGARPPLDRLGPQRCPRRLHLAILSCWEPDPLRRPAAAELLKALLLQREDLARAQASGGTSVDAQSP